MIAGISLRKMKWKRAAAVLMALAITASLASCASNKTDTSQTSSTLSVPDIFRKPIGSFIQLWYCKGWSENRWDQEFTQMKQAGFQFIILQSVTEVNYDTDAGKTQFGEDYTQYKLTSASSLYPSDLPDLKNTNGGVDTLKNCLDSAKKNGMKVMIGPYSDNRWWIYGWNMPTAAPGVTDLVNDSYYGRWAKDDAAMSNKVADEIWQKYGKDYGDVIYGWYYWNEIWNMTLPCQGKDDGVYTKILANSFNSVLQNYTQISPGKPFLFSPYVNFTLTTPAQYEKMWKDLFKLVNFRNGDIFCPQDSVGGNPDKLPVLAQWVKDYKAAVDTKSGLKLWMNNEDFTAAGGPAMVDRYVNQIKITAQYCEQNIVFSWNHYYSPSVGKSNPGYNNTYLDYINNGRLDSSPPGDPQLSIDPQNPNQIDIATPKDNIGVAGYYVFRHSETNRVSTLLSTRTDPPYDYVASTKGTYYIQAFDFAGNVSQKVMIEVK